jgi:ABC-type branched-subunit amino acid transport system permease subunit
VSSFVEMHHAIMGVVFIATVLWAPRGLVGLAAQLRARLARRGEDKR